MAAKIKLDEKRIHAKVVRQLEMWVKAMPPAKRKRAIVGIASEAGRTLSPEEILKQVRELTPLGIQFIENGIALDTVDGAQYLNPSARRERAKLS
ncbi:MAG TPA: hypothetical protein VNE82_14310 [Candidatus Binataceae bacterium]|nr:hypothetical protein [Candidatus Binataceae bacterium]